MEFKSEATKEFYEFFREDNLNNAQDAALFAFAEKFAIDTEIKLSTNFVIDNFAQYLIDENNNCLSRFYLRKVVDILRIFWKYSDQLNLNDLVYKKL